MNDEVISAINQVGRPLHQPTEDKRLIVRLMSSMQKSQNEIAKYVGVGIHTLRRDYADDLENGKHDLDMEAMTALRRGISKDDATLIKFYLERRVAAFKPEPERAVDINIHVGQSMDEILKQIDGTTAGLPDFTKQPRVIEHEPQPVVAEASSDTEPR